MFNYYSLNDFRLFYRLSKLEGSAIFFPSRSMKLKNKRKKNIRRK